MIDSQRPLQSNGFGLFDGGFYKAIAKAISVPGNVRGMYECTAVIKYPKFKSS